MPDRAARAVVVVAGDAGVDHHLYHSPPREKDGGAGGVTRWVTNPGGMALLSLLLRHVGAEQEERPAFDVIDCFTPAGTRAQPATFSVWRAVPRIRGDDDSVWRLSQSLGRELDATVTPASTVVSGHSESVRARVLVIGDAGGARHPGSDREPWYHAILTEAASGSAPTTGPEWIVLLAARPLCAGDLWRTLTRVHSDRLVALVDGDDLRQEGVQLGRGLSWEGVALELAAELPRHPVLRGLTNGARHVVISLGLEGAIWIDARQRSDPILTLIYDPGAAEGEWTSRIDGRVSGARRCLAASLTSHLAGTGGTNLAMALAAGLSAGRVLQLEGHGPASDPAPAFPFARTAAEILAARPGHPFASVRVPSAATRPSPPSPRWNIIAGAGRRGDDTPLPLVGTAQRVALYGARALGRIPHARFGKLFTVDRSEMEGLRGLAQLIDTYARGGRAQQPLSIAVFGPPGSGKSFSVKQIAATRVGVNASLLEFNLSQFLEPHGIADALQQARNKALEGALPFVFWDEFDSQQYRWLQYFLAPMEDGRFIDGDLSNPVGKCVFVFAGATSRDFEHFGPHPASDRYADFRLSKGPDFKSRVHGHLDVLGPNRRQIWDDEDRDWTHDDPEDVLFPVRRALLIRSALGCREQEMLKMDRGVLAALLQVRRYAHGARSLRTLLGDWRPTPDGGAWIPPHREVLSMHVDHDEFWALVRKDEAFRGGAAALAPSMHERWRSSSGRGSAYDVEFSRLPPEVADDNLAAAERIARIFELIGLRIVPIQSDGRDATGEAADLIEANLELLAEEEHEGWMEQRLRNGWELAARRDDPFKKHPSLRPYSELESAEKEKDRSAVRHYPSLLRACGYKVIFTSMD